MKQWNAFIASLVVIICAGVAFAAPLYACGEPASGVEKKTTHVAAEKSIHGRDSKKITTTGNQPLKQQRSTHKKIASSRPQRVATTPVGPVLKKNQSLARVDGVDIKTLEKRLKSTDAIGFFTKLAIRNNIVDLMDKIKRYRKKSLLKVKIKEIRSSFDGLLLKIIALLDEDPKLSRDLYVGRESIWESLLEVKT